MVESLRKVVHPDSVKTKMKMKNTRKVVQGLGSARAKKHTENGGHHEHVFMSNSQVQIRTSAGSHCDAAHATQRLVEFAIHSG